LRVCRGCFPTRARLLSRGIHCPNVCVMCGTNYEDSIHVLLECPGAMQAWREVNLWEIINRTLRQNYNIDALIFSLLDQLPSMHKELFVTIMWSLWKRRNLKLWQQQNETCMQVVERARHLLDDWRTAQEVRSHKATDNHAQPNSVIHGHVIEWTKLAYGRYKCNIDASFSDSLNMVGIGICIRDDQGEFVMAKTNCFSPLCDVDVGKAIGLHTTLQWVADLHYDHVDFVLDSKSVIERFNSNLVDSSELGCIIQACRQLFDCNFQNSHVEFNRRQANGVTHELARVAPSHASSL